MGQMNFSDLDWASKKKTTRREQFLLEMNQVVPWERLMTLISPHYSKAGSGRHPTLALDDTDLLSTAVVYDTPHNLDHELRYNSDPSLKKWTLS